MSISSRALVVCGEQLATRVKVCGWITEATAYRFVCFALTLSLQLDHQAVWTLLLGVLNAYRLHLHVTTETLCISTHMLILTQDPREDR